MSGPSCVNAELGMTGSMTGSPIWVEGEGGGEGEAEEEEDDE